MKGSNKGSSKGHGYKGKGNFGWRWRPFRSKGKGKGKGKYKEKGKGKSYGKHWYASTLPTVPRGLNTSQANPDASTTLTSTTRPQEYNISTPPDEEVCMTRSTSSTDPAEGQEPPAANQADKKHLGAFSFAFNFYEAADYFAVRGEKRRGLIIDPGAASGLIGCDTLKNIIEHCIQPYGKHKDIVIDKKVTSPVRPPGHTRPSGHPSTRPSGHPAIRPRDPAIRPSGHPATSPIAPATATATRPRPRPPGHGHARKKSILLRYFDIFLHKIFF